MRYFERMEDFAEWKTGFAAWVPDFVSEKLTREEGTWNHLLLLPLGSGVMS